MAQSRFVSRCRSVQKPKCFRLRDFSFGPGGFFMRNYKKHGDLVYSVLLSCFFIFHKQLKQDETKESKGMKLMYLSETHRHCTMNLEPT